MADVLGQAADWLERMRRRHMTRRVVYSRGGESAEIAATLGSTTYELTDEAGATVQAKATDFLVSADELILAGELVEPRPGDRIRVADGERTRIFEVMDLAGAGHCRLCDPHGRTLRIHAKQIDEVTG